jgi:hypothetical protein
MTTEFQEGPIEAAPVATTPAKLSWRQQRYQRRRRRVWFEEVLGWILVPVIVFGCYWLVTVGLNAVGTSPSAIIEGISSIRSNL